MADTRPFADGSTEKLRAGDTVFHIHANEEWVVLADTGAMVAWAGWPPGMENRTNLRPQTYASPAKHAAIMDDIRNGQHPLRHIILRENGGMN